MLILLGCLVGFLTSAQGYQWCDAQGRCEDVSTADDNLCCEHVYREERCPNTAFASRSLWHAAPPRRAFPLTDRDTVEEVFLDYTETESCDGLSRCSERVRQIQRYDMDTRGLDDIAANFLFSNTGRVFIGTRFKVNDGKQLTCKVVGFKGKECEDKDILKKLERTVKDLKCIRELHVNIIRFVTTDSKGKKVVIPQPVTAAKLKQIWCG